MNDDHPLAGPAARRLSRRRAASVAAAWARSTGPTTSAWTGTVALKVLPPGPRTSARERPAPRVAARRRPGSPERHPDLRGGRDGRPALHRDAVRRGGDLRELLRREGALAPARAVAIARAGRRRAGRRPPPRPRPPRRQAEQRAARRRRRPRALLPGRLRPHPARRGGGAADGHLMGTVAYVAPEQIRGDAIDGRADQYALAGLLFECLTGTAPYDGRSDVAVIFAHLEEPVPPASGRDPRCRPRSTPCSRAGWPRTRASASPRAPSSCAPRAPRSGSTARRAAAPAAMLLPAALAVVALAAAAIAVLGDGGKRAARRDRRHRADRPAGRTRVASSTPVDGHPGELAVTPGGIWMADFRDGVLWRYEPGSGRRRADDLDRRAARPRRARPQGLRRCRRPLPQRHRLPLRRRQRRPGGRHRAARVRDGVRRGRGLGGGLPVRPAAEHRRRPAAQARRGLPPVPAAGDGSRRRGPSSASLPWAPARCGSWATRSTGACGGSTPARAPRQAVLDLGFPPTSLAVAAGRVWITDGVGDRVVPIDIERGLALPAVPVGRGPSGIAAGAGGCGWPTRSMAPCRGWIRRRAAWWRRSTWRARRAASRSALGAVWVTEHAP